MFCQDCLLISWLFDTAWICLLAGLFVGFDYVISTPILYRIYLVALRSKLPLFWNPFNSCWCRCCCNFFSKCWIWSFKSGVKHETLSLSLSLCVCVSKSRIGWNVSSLQWSMLMGNGCCNDINTLLEQIKPTNRSQISWGVLPSVLCEDLVFHFRLVDFVSDRGERTTMIVGWEERKTKSNLILFAFRSRRQRKDTKTTVKSNLLNYRVKKAYDMVV